MPVLYVHGEHDPRQPVDYCRGMEDHIPGLEAILVLDSGHFVTRERPQEMTDAMMWFYHSMLGSGLPLFERSRHRGGGCRRRARFGRRVEFAAQEFGRVASG